MPHTVRQHRRVDLDLPTSLHNRIRADFDHALDGLGSDDAHPWAKSVSFKGSYLSSNVWSKYIDDSLMNSSRDRKTKAIEKWLAVEKRNARTNIRLMIDNPNFGKFDFESLMSRTRIIVLSIIGQEPPEDVYLGGRFTNGASTRVRRGPGASARKYVGKPHITQCANEIFQERFRPHLPLWEKYVELPNLEVMPGSEMFTVPKNTEIDRVACKEPEINMYMQRSCGLFIRAQLRAKCGINLQKQGPNQVLAKEGSLTGHLATIDLSSASDSISTQLIAELLPAGWFFLLDRIRSKSVSIDGELHEMHMFSSMGNGFTFELETLVFYALARAVCYLDGARGRISVYGDDIIVPSSAAPLLKSVFNFCGFTLNAKKSFWKGRFRESCGKHYYCGADVSPFFIRRKISKLPDLIHFLNQLRKWATHPEVGVDLYTGRFSDLWHKYAPLVPKYLWGGKDPDSIACLVTRGAPRKMLVAKSKVRRVDEVGGFLSWMNNSEFVLDIETSSEGETLDDCLVAKNRTWEQTLPLYLEWGEETFTSLSVYRQSTDVAV